MKKEAHTLYCGQCGTYLPYAVFWGTEKDFIERGNRYLCVNCGESFDGLIPLSDLLEWAFDKGYVSFFRR